MSRTFLNRRNWRVGLTVLAMVLVPLGFVPGQASATCSAFTFHGTAHGPKGVALRGYDIAIFVHGQDRALKPSRTGDHGGFNISSVCKEPKMATYAKHHNGHVDFDVLAHAHHHKGSFFVRTVRVAHGAHSVAVPARFAKAKTVNGSRSRATSQRSNAPGFVPVTGSIAVGTSIVRPSVMAIEAVRHMRVDYDMSSDTVRGIKAEVGLSSGGYGASGTMSIAGTAEFSSGRTLRTPKGKAHVARVVQPLLAVNSKYVCPAYSTYSGGFNFGGSQCVTVSSGQWTGDIKQVSGKYHGCSSGSAPLVFGNNHNTRYWKVGRGATFSSSVKGGISGGSLTVYANYTSGTSVTYKLDQTKAKHGFCLGGGGKHVSTSAKLYISLQSDTGGGGCRVGTNGKAEEPSMLPC